MGVGVVVVTIPFAAPFAVGIGVGLIVRHEAVTIVVLPVADLRRSGMGVGVVVVTIPFAAPFAVGIGVGLVLGHYRVAVVVQPVADLSRTRIGVGVTIVAIPVTDAGTVTVRIDLIGRYNGVAIVVQAVTDLGRTGVGVGVVIVAIAVADPFAVGIGVGLVGRHDGVAVIVQSVADLRCARVGVDVAVVTIAAGQAGIVTAGDSTVVIAVGVGVGASHDAVRVQSIGVAVAVIVDPVLTIGIFLDLSGVDVRVGVVAVACDQNVTGDYLPAVRRNQRIPVPVAVVVGVPGVHHFGAVTTALLVEVLAAPDDHLAVEAGPDRRVVSPIGRGVDLGCRHPGIGRRVIAAAALRIGGRIVLIAAPDDQLPPGPHGAVADAAHRTAHQVRRRPLVGHRIVPGAVVHVLAVAQSAAAPYDHLVADPGRRVQVSGLGRIDSRRGFPTIGRGIVPAPAPDLRKIIAAAAAAAT